MSLTYSDLKGLVLRTVREVSDDDVPSLAAAIAYYMVFSLPPLLVLIVALAGTILGPAEVADLLADQARSAVGPDAGEAVRGMIESAGETGGGVGGKVLGVLALLFGATGAFGQLQKALNRAWEVEEASKGNALKEIVVKRVLSFGMVLTIAFLLLVSLVLTAVLSALGGAAESAVGGGGVGFVVKLLNLVVGFGVVAALFAVLFRYLPDAQIAWRDVAVGAVFTAVLFTIGRYAIGIYLGTASPGSAFGAAGSLALLLVWIYYSALIVLVGAEFTQAWAVREGGGITPDDEVVEGSDPDGAPEVTVGGTGAPVHPLAEPRDPAPY
ncbi:YihY/virulence factor BrkB family protein [Rubrivirga sp. IMCC45206]|uniref:YihY/virulence factor BrkB family protein n=1 Tax=Rubrivirga sp. IMCC45206 TaxID=3391614 RepID=UPI00398FDE05